MLILSLCHLHSFILTRLLLGSQRSVYSGLYLLSNIRNLVCQLTGYFRILNICFLCIILCVLSSVICVLVGQVLQYVLKLHVQLHEHFFGIGIFCIIRIPCTVQTKKPSSGSRKAQLFFLLHKLVTKSYLEPIHNSHTPYNSLILS